jgi:hypothetical protein
MQYAVRNATSFISVIAVFVVRPIRVKRIAINERNSWKRKVFSKSVKRNPETRQRVEM